MAGNLPRYIPATEADVRKMLGTVGVADMAALLELLIPGDDQLRRDLDLPPGISEPVLVAGMKTLAAANIRTEPGRSFLGGGAYAHHIPAAIHHLTARGEFFTAYTPYQPEVAQGTLQALYEFQTMVCELLGMDVANASTYDGASSLAEAIGMAWRIGKGKRGKALLAGAVHPDAMATCCAYHHAGIVALSHLAPSPDGRIDLMALQARVDRDTCCVAVQSPNFYGLIEDLPAIAKIAHDAGALFVVLVTDPHACALFATPGEAGADIAVAEGQALGVPLSFGGPYVGLFATREAHIRQMPGRLVGRTTDVDGAAGFVLTLSTREQHIRRAKATSNICTNHGLCALMVSIYLSLQGPDGLRDVARQSHARALYLRRAIQALPGFSLPHDGPFFHEFVVHTPSPARAIVNALAADGFFAGVPLDLHEPARTHDLLVCATEINTRSDMDAFAARLGKEV